MTTIYFHVPDVGHATGGVRAAYRMVDACNAAGLPAAIMHQRRGFRPGWFNSDTTVVYAQDTKVHGDDVLVVSELDAQRLLHRAPGVTKVVLNQHHYWTFVHGPVDYRHPDVALVIAVSDDGERYLSYAFPDVDLRRVHYAVDGSLFAPVADRRRAIGYLATKGGGPRTQVLRMLEARGVLRDWELRPMSGLTQSEMARELSSLAILATFSESEGFQMLLTEAMLAGCAVVGFDAGGGSEFLTEDTGWPVPAMDVVRFAERLEEVTRAWDEDRTSVLARVDRASRMVRERYTLEREAADAVDAMSAAVAIARGKPSAPTHDVAELPRVGQGVRRKARAVARALRDG
jgi:hypothetical protein